MFERVRRTEWPLVIFTLGMQVAAGLAIAATVCDRIPGAASSGTADWLGIAVAPVAAIAMASSLLHLGRPRSSWRALLNLTSSPLSREVLVSVLFLLSALLYGSSCLAGVSGMRSASGLATSLLGFAAVGAGSVVYLIPTQPGWNSWHTPFSFVAMTILIASLATRLALADTHLFASRTATGVIVIASIGLVASTMATARRRPGISARLSAIGFKTSSAYCALLCVTAVWMWLRPIPGTRLVDVVILVALLAAAGMQRAAMYDVDRLPEF